MVNVRLDNVVKVFDKVIAADHITLTIKHGEFFTFLGPSGCGKTTTLRIIAGLEYPDEGRIYFDEEDVTEYPPYMRDTGMVFQNYALWPHMTVFDNIAYGLKIRRLPMNEIKERVYRVLDLVKLRGLENRYPTQLSGGQQQRVALARALIVKPKVLLLDEPLSNLDAKLRIEMREEIKRLQRELGITTIYVTHDQEEAMVISDRVAIMRQGRIMQIGHPREVYKRPANLFVASFMGRCTILKGIVRRSGEITELSVDGVKILGVPSATDMNIREGSLAVAILRPEEFELVKPHTPSNEFEGVVEWSAFTGPYTQLRVKVSDKIKILLDIDPDSQIKVGSTIKCYIPYSDTIILPFEEGREITYMEES